MGSAKYVICRAPTDIQLKRYVGDLWSLENVKGFLEVGSGPAALLMNSMIGQAEHLKLLGSSALIQI